MDNINVQVFSQEKPTKFLSLPKIIFIILGLIVLVEVVYAVKVLITPSPAPVISLSKQTAIQKGVSKISLTTSKATFNINKVVPVAVMVDTGNRSISGADLIVRFDPKILDITSSGLVKGAIFNEYPLISADSKTGMITISGISNEKSGFKGTGQFAMINFKAKSAGKASLTIDSKKGSTANSNLVDIDTSKNILETVDNLEITIQ